MVNVYSYSSVRNFVIAGTDENGENWYMTNNKQFTVCNGTYVGMGLKKVWTYCQAP